MSDWAQITVRRTNNYPDRLRSYKIEINGVVVGSVRARESATVRIAPGRHSLTLRIDRCGSGQIDFDAESNEHILFECGNNSRGISALFRIIFRPRQYLWLHQVT
jgi:hypothetical protein